MHDEHSPSHTSPLRNCLWSRVLSYIPIPMLDRERCTDSAPGDSSEKRIVRAGKSTLPLRARIVVSHLTLSRPTAEDIVSQDLPFVSEGVGIPGLRVFLAVCATELSAVVTAFGIFAAYRSLWALLWFLPLLLRLIGTFFALEHEPLVSTSSSVASDPPCDFEFHCPQSESSFMVVTGPPALLLQFFRHYGYPIRNQFREIVQLSTIVAFALQFPLGWFCSSMWMTVEVQYVWLSYQLYVVLAMHIVRYSVTTRSTNTEAKLAECLDRGSLMRRLERTPPPPRTSQTFYSATSETAREPSKPRLLPLTVNDMDRESSPLRNFCAATNRHKNSPRKTSLLRLRIFCL